MIENKSAAIMAEITKAVIGKNDIVEKILMAVLAGGHVLMEDIPGVGKTTMALAFSRVCLLYTSPSPRDSIGSRMPSSA